MCKSHTLKYRYLLELRVQHIAHSTTVNSLAYEPLNIVTLYGESIAFINTANNITVAVPPIVCDALASQTITLNFFPKSVN